MALNRRLLYLCASALLLCLYLINIFQVKNAENTVFEQQRAPPFAQHNIIDLLTPADQGHPVADPPHSQPPNPPAVATPTKPKPPPPSLCPGVRRCPVNQTSMAVYSGYGTKVEPYICINGKNVTGHPPPIGRGINVVVVDGTVNTVLSRASFDTYENKDACYDFVEYATTEVPMNSYMIIASHDDMTAKLCKHAVKMIEIFGGSKIKSLKFRDTYVLISRKGAPAPIIEQLGKPAKKDSFGERVTVSGCLPTITSMYDKIDPPPLPELPDCGISCRYDEVSVLVSTGFKGRTRPKLCVGNEYVFAPKLRGGRGFNLAIICPYSKSVVRHMYFDAYKRETSPIDTFLLDVPPGFLLVGVTHDDVATSLGNYTKSLFRTFGITLIDEVKMRTVMYFAGRKGLKASRFQNASHVIPGATWPDPLNRRFCLPLVLMDHSLAPQQTIEDQSVTSVTAPGVTRQQFCDKDDGFFHFCFGDNRLTPVRFYKPWTALPQSGFDPDVYNIPILLLASFNKEAVAEAVDTLAKQPGIHTDKVFIAYPSIFAKDYKAITSLFFGSNGTMPISTFSTYAAFLGGALSAAWNRTTGNYLIVIDEDVIPSASFQFYMGQVLAGMKAGYTDVAGATNENGFTFMSGSSENQVQYVDHFPTSAFMISRRFYETEIQGRTKRCCSVRSWQGWFRNGASGGPYKYLIPEVSRAAYFDPDSYWRHRTYPGKEAFHTPLVSKRPTSLQVVTQDIYLENMRKSIDSAKTLDSEKFLRSCSAPLGHVERLRFAFGFDVNPGNVALVYRQENPSDRTQLSLVYSCLNLTQGSEDDSLYFGAYKGMTRIKFMGNYLYIVGSQSSLR